MQHSQAAADAAALFPGASHVKAASGRAPTRKGRKRRARARSPTGGLAALGAEEAERLAALMQGAEESSQLQVRPAPISCHLLRGNGVSSP